MWIKALKRRIPWNATRRARLAPSERALWLNTFGPSPSPPLSYQFCSAPALFPIPNAGHSASSFISRLASNLSSLCSEIHHLSGFFSFLFSICQTSPRLALNYSLSVSSPSCAAPLYLTPLFCHPYSVASHAVINFPHLPHPPGIRFPSTLPRGALCFSTLPSQRWSLPLIF